ncbi:uncharacterized protein C9orf131 homolog [Erinaceus europaeus]|uniref:Uncharacterized protein C9orf131 homolog n=1 Tax=Erinaceus europaeus TaxID=9365 RepID=A0ABM3Y2C9_ERIEU|nr:uncharacterized protein C9orf131 homolog [Erinaceus europaeus]
MEWLLAGLAELEGDMRLLWSQLTHTLACRHCGSNCLQSPGNLATLFLFVVWQIRRWWQLGRWQQLQSWYSGDITQGKGLPLLYWVTILDHLWEQKSEEEGEEEEEEEEDEEEEEEEKPSLDPLKLCSIPKEVQIGEQVTIAPSQSSFCPADLYEDMKTSEQVLTETRSPSRSFPAFQVLTNFPVRYRATPGGHLQPSKSQLFWGLPSLHSESLATIFLSSPGSSPMKLSVSYSVFFNKLPFLSRSNLPLPQYCSPTQLSTHKDLITEHLQGMVLHPKQLPSSSSPSAPSLPCHFQSFPTDHEGLLSGTQTYTHWPAKQREVSEGETLSSQSRLQKITPSRNFPSSEVRCRVPKNPSFQQHILDSLSTSLLYPSSLLGILSRFEAPRKTMGKNVDPKASQLPVPTPTPTPISLPKLQGVNPVRHLSGSQALWETTRQRENPKASEPPILSPCQSVIPTTEPQGSRPLGVEYEAWWGKTEHKNPPESESPVESLPCQLPESLSESRTVSPEDESPAAKDFWEDEHRDNPQASGSPAPAPCAPPKPRPGLQGGSHLGGPSVHPSQWGCRENSETPWAFESPPLNLNPGHSGASPAETPRKDMQSENRLWVSADTVSSCGHPSSSLPVSLGTDPRGVFPKCKVLWENSGQRENLWASGSPAPDCSPPLTLAVHSLQPVPRSPAQAEAPKIESYQLGLLKGEPSPDIKAETPPSQGGAVPEVPARSGTQAWQWSRELGLKLKKLQQRSASRSPIPNQSFGNSPATSSTTLSSCGLSSCPPQQTRVLGLCPQSSSCQPPAVSSTVTQPVHISRSFSLSWLERTGRAEQGSERERQRMVKMVAQVSAQRLYAHMKAGENCSVLGEPSHPEIPATDKRGERASAQSPAKSRHSPRNPKARSPGGGIQDWGHPQLQRKVTRPRSKD